jgi:pyruvate-formate lyase-activating enzyme
MLLKEDHMNKKKKNNYQPVTKRVSCMFLENHCIAADGMLSFCYSDDKNKSLGVVFNGNYSETVENFFALRQQILHNINKNIPTSCSNCQGLVLGDYPTKQDDSPLKLFTYQNGGNCNFRCSYCVATKTRKVSEMNIELPELFTELKVRGLLAPNFSCAFSAGEISINPRCKEICEALQICDNFKIFTNALVYNKHISALLSSGRGSIIVSIDSGTQETFKKVKGVDAFNRVCNTLRQYGRESKETIVLKYIFLPGINDNETDIDGFVALANEIKCNYITISSDLFNTHLIEEHTISMAKYLGEKVKKMSIFCDINSPLAEKMPDHTRFG